MLLNICITAAIIVIGGLKISYDIKSARDLSKINLAQSHETTLAMDRLVRQQLPLRTSVARQKLLVDRFSYEFQLFVAKEEGDIGSLNSALEKMVANYKHLESIWMENLPQKKLHQLKANINMSIGIFEEANEFKTVGFGELYRLGEDSKIAVETLISVMVQIETLLDQVSDAAVLSVFEESAITSNNERALSELLQSVSKKSLFTLSLVFFIVILFQIIFFFFHKQRLVYFSSITKFISKKGDLSTRIDLKSKDEFGQLANSFNQMLEHLEATTNSEKFLNSIVESMNDMVLVLSSKGIIKTVNKSTICATGLKERNLIGRTFFKLLVGGDQGIAELLLMQKKIVHLERVLIVAKDKKMPVMMSILPLNLSGKEQTTDDLICTLTDITQRLESEKEKIQAQKVAADQAKYALIGQVAGKMAHDFNNVLGVIMGNAEISLMTCTDDELKQTFKLIFDQTIRGKNLTKNLIAFAQSQEPKQEFFKIHDKFDLVVRLLKKDLNEIELIIEDNTNGTELLADPGMIEHTLVNLIQNSIHATCHEDHPKIFFRTYCSEKFICLEIEDNGCGIPKEYQHSIFDPSFTLKGSKDTYGSYNADIKGTGYGMANVKKYIDQHKGDIRLDSRFGSGTKFIIRLPIIKKELSVAEKKEINETKLLTGKNILIVEDEKAISDVQYTILTQKPCNHKVDIAISGQQAIELYVKNKYDCLSLDYILPGGINGMDIYNKVRQGNKKIPILFLSGNIEFLESIADLQESDLYLDHRSKPCQNKDYINSLNRLLEKTS